jgi:hypothetical protein
VLLWLALLLYLVGISLLVQRPCTDFLAAERSARWREAAARCAFSELRRRRGEEEQMLSRYPCSGAEKPTGAILLMRRWGSEVTVRRGGTVGKRVAAGEGRRRRD